MDWLNKWSGGDANLKYSQTTATALHFQRPPRSVCSIRTGHVGASIIPGFVVSQLSITLVSNSGTELNIKLIIKMVIKMVVKMVITFIVKWVMSSNLPRRQPVRI